LAQKLGFEKWSSLEIVVVVVVAAVFGVVMTYGQFLFDLAYAAGGFWAANLLAGVFHTPGLMAAYMVRKKYTAFTTQMLNSVATVLLGSPTGLNDFMFGFLEGVGFEAGLAIWRYKRYDWLSIGVAAALSAPLSSLWVYVWLSLWTQPFWSWFPAEALKFLYIQPYVLLIGVGLPKSLEKAGVILPYQRGVSSHT
jgi:ABC-type thiamin/hydroxymethylpyrimidine transport system permease subunit